MLFEKFKNLKSLLGTQILKDNDIVPIHPSLANGLPAGWTIDKTGNLQPSPDMYLYSGSYLQKTYDVVVYTELNTNTPKKIYNPSIFAWCDGELKAYNQSWPLKATKKLDIETDASGICDKTVVDAVANKKIQIIAVAIKLRSACSSYCYLYSATSIERQFTLPEAVGYYYIYPVLWAGNTGEAVKLKCDGSASSTLGEINLIYREVG